jgi:hypothetical protein
VTRAHHLAKSTLPAGSVFPRIFQAAPFLLAVGCILFVRIGLGFQFPVPWPDETGFVAPAFDFARSGSFFDSGMNPDLPSCGCLPAMWCCVCVPDRRLQFFDRALGLFDCLPGNAGVLRIARPKRSLGMAANRRRLDNGRGLSITLYADRRECRAHGNGVCCVHDARDRSDRAG